MTDRLKGLVVSFSGDIREDDAQGIIDAILLIKGVGSVKTSDFTGDDWINRSQIKIELREKLFKVLE